jgi:uncharacterized damage-inducible protein DinB
VETWQLLDTALLRPIFRYNTSANEQIRKAAIVAGDELLRRPLDLWYGTMYDLLAHVTGAEQNWLIRVRDRATPPGMPSAGDYAGLDALLTRWRELDAEWEAYVATLHPTDLDASLRWTNQRGEPQEAPQWRPIVQVPFHSTEHRGHAGAGLTLLGIQHGQLDLLFQNPPIEA